jgi:hypothetical protein
MERQTAREALTWVLTADDTRGGGLVVAVQLGNVDDGEEKRVGAGVNFVHLKQHPRVKLNALLVQPQTGTVGCHDLQRT